jgi:hypothetical protein
MRSDQQSFGRLCLFGKAPRNHCGGARLERQIKAFHFLHEHKITSLGTGNASDAANITIIPDNPRADHFGNLADPPLHGTCFIRLRRERKAEAYNEVVEKKIFWIIFIFLGLVADFTLPILWSMVATIPIAVVSWWIAYRSEWF